MIARLNGELVAIEADSVILDVNGVGYKTCLPLSTIAELPPLGSRLILLISTVVKEDSISLYGFIDEDQKTLFNLLTNVNGVGPRVAMNILSVLPVEKIINAISNDSYIELNQVPGVGVKTAQKIVIELKDKIVNLKWSKTLEKLHNNESLILNDVVSGLIALGYNSKDAKKAAEQAADKCVDRTDTGEILKQALQLLSKG
ncbi:MAG: Holliday junction branch migration protein RuvA [Armatimonadota bacterium]